MSIKFKKIVIENISSINQGKVTLKLPIYGEKGNIMAILRPVTNKTIRNIKEINLLKKWREENNFAFPTQFKVTFEGTKKWVEQLVNNSTRILFFIEDVKKSSIIGHLGFYSFNFKDDSCEIDNVVRGDKNRLKGVMTAAMSVLIQWAMNKLQPKDIFLRVFSDNERAVLFYERCGFKKYDLISLERAEIKNTITWIENKKLKNASKFFLKMIYKVDR